MPKESERKFVLNRLPDLDLGEGVPYRQGYVMLPYATISMRLRDEGGHPVLTFKGPGLAIKDEANFPLDSHPWLSEALWTSTDSRKILKKRSTIPDPGGDGNIEIDVFEGEHPTLKGKLMMEREFLEGVDIGAWIPHPALSTCIAREVTGNPKYQNSALAKNGWPVEDDE
jgi:adenylate cyclase